MLETRIEKVSGELAQLRREARPNGGQTLAILPGLTHYNVGVSPLFAATTLAFLDEPRPAETDN